MTTGTLKVAAYCRMQLFPIFGTIRWIYGRIGRHVDANTLHYYAKSSSYKPPFGVYIFGVVCSELVPEVDFVMNTVGRLVTASMTLQNTHK